jgi:hypothetical protein
MNNRIKELAFESGFASAGFEHGRPILTYEKELTRFARLIIEDCMGIAMLSDGNGPQVAQEIKHFFTTNI